MTIWIVLSAVAALILLLALTPVGCVVRYSADGLFLWARLGPLRVRLLPAKKKRNRREKPPKKKKERRQAAHQDEKKPGALQMFMQLLAPVCKTLDKLRRKLRIDTLELTYVIAGAEDPASAAIQYGAIAAGGGVLLPLIDTYFLVKNWDTNINVDFDARQATVYLKASARYRLGQLVAIAIGFFIQWVKIKQKQQPVQQARRN